MKKESDKMINDVIHLLNTYKDWGNQNDGMRGFGGGPYANKHRRKNELDEEFDKIYTENSELTDKLKEELEEIFEEIAHLAQYWADFDYKELNAECREQKSEILKSIRKFEKSKEYTSWKFENRGKISAKNLGLL